MSEQIEEVSLYLTSPSSGHLNTPEVLKVIA